MVLLNITLFITTQRWAITFLHLEIVKYRYYSDTFDKMNAKVFTLNWIQKLCLRDKLTCKKIVCVKIQRVSYIHKIPKAFAACSRRSSIY